MPTLIWIGKLKPVPATLPAVTALAQIIKNRSGAVLTALAIIPVLMT